MNNNPMSSTATCIYCGGTVRLGKGRGDHIIPVQLGEFREDVRFQRICQRCNSQIGKSEQQLLQCGNERFFRDIVKPNVPSARRRRRKRGRPQGRGAAGAPGPVSTYDHGDHHALMNPLDDGSQNAHPVDHIVIQDGQGGEHYFELFQGMRLEQLRERISKKHIKRIVNAWLHCVEKRWNEYEPLLQAICPKGRIEELPSMERGIHRVQGRITLTVTNHYFRALAKIAFHYYLARCRRKFVGDEDCFSQIRDFIMIGGDVDQFFRHPGPTFLMPFGKLPCGDVITPRQWCHVFVADESSNVLGVYMQLFVGPGFIPEPRYITLGTVDKPIIVPSFVLGH